MNYPWIIGFIMGLIIGYVFWPGGVLSNYLQKRRAPKFKITLDRAPAGIIDFTKDQTIDFTFEWKAPAPGDVNTDDFEIPEYLEER